MSVAGSVLLDSACSPQVREAVLAVFPGLRLRTVVLEVAAKDDRAALSQAHAVIFDLRTREGEPSADVIELVRTIAPHVGIFVVTDRLDDLTPWLRRLAISGADDAFALDRVGEERLLREVVLNRVQLPPPEEALRKLWSYWAGNPVRTEAMHCVRNGYRKRHEFAPHKWFGLKDRAMRTQFDRARIPTPFFLIRFGRDLHWRKALQSDTLTKPELLTLLGFATVSEQATERRRLRKRAEPWPVLSALFR